MCLLGNFTFIHAFSEVVSISSNASFTDFCLNFYGRFLFLQKEVTIGECVRRCQYLVKREMESRRGNTIVFCFTLTDRLISAYVLTFVRFHFDFVLCLADSRRSSS